MAAALLVNRRPQARARFRACADLARLGLCLAALAGCGGDDDDGPADADRPHDVRRPDDAGTPQWTAETVATGHVGLFTDMVLLSGGRVGLAYYASAGVDVGACDPLPTNRVDWTLAYSEGTAGGTFARTEVGVLPFVGEPPGLDLEVTPAGEPAIATMAGPIFTGRMYCGGNDAGLFVRSGGAFALEIAVTDSGQAVSGESGSDFGFVVGYWPGLAYDAMGNPAIVYKDVHNGSIQSDDFRIADVELAWRRGGWSATPVDVGLGGGEFNAITFDDQNRPVVAFYNPTDQSAQHNLGVWVARSSDEGATWDKVRLHGGNTSQGLDIARGPDDKIYVAYYSVDDAQAVLATLNDADMITDSTAGWTLEMVGDGRYDEGRDPSIAFDADGNVALAYYRCAATTSGVGDCNAMDDALVFARKTDDTWRYEIADEGEQFGQCGRYPTLAFDEEGVAYIGYTCQAMVGASEVEDRVRLATRPR